MRPISATGRPLDDRVQRMKLPSPATLIATAALCCAMAGTGIAAGRYIITNTSQISPAVVKDLQSPPVQIMSLTQDPPTLTPHLQVPGTSTVGDYNTFIARLRHAGRVIGVVNGERTLVELGSNVNWTVTDHIPGARIGQSLALWDISYDFHFSHADSILVQGDAVYPLNPDPLLSVGVAQYRAIIGGTGKYRFAHGQLVTVRHANGSYSQTLEFRSS